MIELIQDEVAIRLYRCEYRLINRDEETLQDDSDIQALELHIGYDCPDGWGSVGDNFLLLSDVIKLKEGLEDVAGGRKNRFEISVNTIRRNCEWMKFLCERVEGGYHFRFEWKEFLFDDLFVIDQVYSPEEWQPYLEEFCLWGETFPVELGDRVVSVDPDEEYFTAGMEGRIDAIYPAEKEGEEVCVMISYTDESWNGPYRTGGMFDLDQVRVIRG